MFIIKLENGGDSGRKFI